MSNNKKIEILSYYEIPLSIKSDVPNVNGIIFTDNAIKTAIKNYKKKYIENKISFGTIGYKVKKQPYSLPLAKVAFRVDDIRKIKNKNEYKSKIAILDTVEGQKLNKKIEKMGASKFKISFFMLGNVIEKNDGVPTIHEFQIEYSCIYPEEKYNKKEI